jgi:DNA polymerase-1
MLNEFDQIWLVRVECSQPPGGARMPWCAVGKNFRTGQILRWRHTDTVCLPVYTTGPRDLVVTYVAATEGECMRSLGWPLPHHCLDLGALYTCYQNRFGSEGDRCGLHHALQTFNLEGLASVEKAEFRQLADRGAPFTGDEMEALETDCLGNLKAVERLIPKLLPHMALPHALLMGRYTMEAVSAVQLAGVPLNTSWLKRLMAAKEPITRALIADANRQYGVYEGGVFKMGIFSAFLRSHGISWPKNKSGGLCMKDDSWDAMSLLHPVLAPLNEHRKSVHAFRGLTPCIGDDGRNRTDLRPFASRTGRNQPSTSQFPYFWPKWMRALIRPPQGRVLVSLDFAQQEFLIGAALAGDTHMISAYRSGDPYLQTAKFAGAVPKSATAATHPDERALFKTAVLAAQYHVTAHGLSSKVGGYAVAERLIANHKNLYPVYHEWSANLVERVLLGGTLSTPFGWTVRKGSQPGHELKARSVSNWPVQASGGDILRIALIALVEHGFCVVAPVHDAIVVECDVDDMQDVISTATRLMEEASAVVLDGEVCRVEATVTHHDFNPNGPDVPPRLKKVLSLLPPL